MEHGTWNARKQPHSSRSFHNLEIRGLNKDEGLCFDIWHPQKLTLNYRLLRLPPFLRIAKPLPV